MLGVWLTLSCICALASPAVASASTIVAGPDFSSESLEGHLDILRDPSGSLTLQDVAFGTHASNFTAIPGALALGYIPDAIWVRIAVAMDEERPQELFLDMRPAVLDDVRVFTPTGSNPRSATEFAEVRLGDHVPFSARVTIATSLVVPFRLPANQRSYIYLRIQTTSTVALRGALRSARSMATYAMIQAIQYGIYQGIFVLMAFANLLYWSRLRDRTYLVYGVWLLFQGILFWCNSGLVPPNIVSGFGPDELTSIAVCMNVTFGTLFVAAQTDARRNFPRMHKIMLTIALFGGVALVPTLMGLYQRVAALLLAIGVLTFIIACACNARLTTRRIPGSALATVACLGQLAGVAITSARLSGLVPYSIWTDYAYESGSLVFTIYMAIALAQRARTAEDERRIAQQQALAVVQSANREAQMLVEERTHELSKAKDLAEAALEAEYEAQQEQVRFIDVISHQYRTPLSIVSSSVSAIRRSLAVNDSANLIRIERIKTAITRLVEVIDVNLHRSRIDGATAHPDIRTVPIAPLIRNIVARAEELTESRRLVIRFEGDTEAADIAADPDMVDLALLNLIENALKFSPANQPVEILCRSDGASLMLSVRDHGIGIPAQERAHLPQKYYRASNSGQTIGMGLGLHIVEKIAHANRGQLTIESAEGTGTCMTLRFARHCQAARPSANQGGPAPER